MAKGKSAPEKSKLNRDRPLAYSKRSKPAEAKPAPKADGKDAPKADEAKPEAAKTEAPKTEALKTEAPKPAAAPQAAEAPKAEGEKSDVPAIEPPPPKGEPWPDATPQPMRPVEPARVTAEMMAVPPPELAPEMPAAPPPPAPVITGDQTVEDPTHMPGPREIPGGSPSDIALPPGRVPPGDSRSLRKGGEFALVYRIQTCVITRSGSVGTRGVWRVVDYPTSSAASNAYAKECSRFVSDGFSDYRD